MDMVKATVRGKLSELRAHAVWIPGVKDLSDEEFFDLACKAELQKILNSGDFWSIFENLVFINRSKGA